MSAGWIAILVCIVCLIFVVGAALPLIGKRGGGTTPPLPRKETLRDWRSEQTRK